MITPEYCQVMARYNAWQNKGYRAVIEAMPQVELERERGAFFGSVLATLNHLLWGDLLWLKRFGRDVDIPATRDRGVDITATGPDWGALRFRTDGQIVEWARSLRALDLAGDLTWTSSTGAVNTEKRWVLATHLFNHQTHHRGQVHAMLTAAGYRLPDTDLAYLPEE